MKKIILYGLVLILLVITISYSNVITVDEIIKPYSADNLPYEMKTSTYFSSYSNKDLDVIGNESKKEIIDLISHIKVKKLLIIPEAYTPKLKETYQIFISNKENDLTIIYILNKKYIRINDKTYKMLNNPDLSGIYNSIILDQPKGLVDEFYYDLLEGN